jgi:CRP/FNR family transcriptional regulator, cyclic AMP receptor protein
MEFLRHLTEEQRDRLLALAEHASASAGTVIIEEDHPAPGVVLVLEGTIGIEKSHLGARVPVDELSAGEMVGEMSYLLGGPATASVVAQDDVRLAILHADVLDRLVATDPAFASNLFRSWAEVLAARLDRRTGDVVGMHWSWG